MPWQATTTTFDSVLARSVTGVVSGLLDGAYGKLKSASTLNRVIGGNSSASAPDRWISKLKLPRRRPLH